MMTSSVSISFLAFLTFNFSFFFYSFPLLLVHPSPLKVQIPPPSSSFLSPPSFSWFFFLTTDLEWTGADIWNYFISSIGAALDWLDSSLIWLLSSTPHTTREYWRGRETAGHQDSRIAGQPRRNPGLKRHWNSSPCSEIRVLKKRIPVADRNQG